MSSKRSMSSVVHCLTRIRKMRARNNLEVPREQLNAILYPMYMVTSFIGHKNKRHPWFGRFGLVLWITSLCVHFALDFYEAKHIFGTAWATAIGVFFVSFTSGTYVIIKDLIPWIEDGLEILYVDGNFTETLEKVKRVAKKLPIIVPVGALFGMSGQYICYYIDGAIQLELKETWAYVTLNVLRVVSLFHILFGYILILVLLLYVMYFTGLSMNEFRVGIEGEFKEKHVRLTFREAVQIFEHRSAFIRRSSNACLYMLVNLVLTTALSFAINAYNFLFLDRKAVYLWFALVPMIWSVTPLTVAAWATETYHSYVTTVVKSWGEHPESDESESEGEEMDEYHEAMKKLKVNRSRSVLIASTNLLKSLKRKRLILKKDRRLSLVAQRRESLVENQLPGQTSPNNFLTVSDSLQRLNEELDSRSPPTLHSNNNSSESLPSNTPLKESPRKSKFNFKSYVMYLQGLIHETGFSIGGIILTWEKVSSLAILLVSVLAVFIQEILFGSRKSTLLT
ncbi:uncharacterized protein LOC5518542 [Nematostella vectensis]|uniref:uncharacterized protein LOC5518542 n=1 Tax=Nematostella vectensis TaxID=45351 RepID=UPI0020778179|nr:uncharacterized protein LOC5518542 [Nematostella vectensis]XP_048576770.1 uncharacterized protein LOC5518542 [Nematostella vectensis]XP_048576771.1 uncharacterized protein LOC5518542 [Nematostella vectensis]XP_048576772.1 uncharacterized protein LOC5518542 [Nematostella vectensis]